MTLERYTWDQAEIAGLASARGFIAMKIPAPTIRMWAARGFITAVAKAPGGAHLYLIAEVSEVAGRPKKRPGRPKPLHNAAK